MPANRKNFASGTEWEAKVGYSRAVKIGSTICVSGTTATSAKGTIVGIGNPYEQTVQIIRNIETALAGLGAKLENVIRTRIFVKDIDDWAEIGKAHSEFFGKLKPATTMVEVSRLIRPEILVEIEADAVL